MTDKSKGAGLFTSFSNGFLQLKTNLRYAYLKEANEELTESIVGLIEELK